MYSSADECLTHQTIDSFDHVVTSDPRFQDRLCFNFHRQPGEPFFVLGLGNYPNQSVMDAYVIARDRRQQTNILLSRRLQHDREQMKIGPLTLEVVEPLKRWRLLLEENAYGLDFDLTYTAKTAILEHDRIYKRIDGYEYINQQHVVQAGTYSGVCRINGRPVDVSGYLGARDRSWGVRGSAPGTRGQPFFDKMGQKFLSGTYVWATVHFDRYFVSALFVVSASGEVYVRSGSVCHYGDPSRNVDLVDFRQEPVREGEEIIGMRLTFTTANGAELVLEQRGRHCVYLIPHGWSDDMDDGTPRGELFMEGYTWNYDSTEGRERIARVPTWLQDTVSEFRCGADQGIGIYESFSHLSGLGA